MAAPLSRSRFLACYRTAVTRFRFTVLILLSVTISTALFPATTAGEQTSPDLTGHWRLNPALSQLPHELGFDADSFQQPAGNQGESAQGGSRSRRGSSGGRYGQTRNSMPRPESAEEASRLRQLTDEARQPPPELTISTASGAITFSDGRGYSRTVQPTGNEEAIDLGGVPVVTITRWESGQLVILYEVEEGRQIRYAYSRTANPDRLTAEVQFIDRGTGDKVTRVYEPASATAPGTTRATPASSAGAPPPTVPAGPPPGAFNQTPGAEFRGLTKVGLVVEGLPSSPACGLTEDAIDSAVATYLKAAGLKVLRNTDEDTYVYVNVNTATVSNGLCVSRYDVSLTTHTTATMSYQPSQPPVLVEVSLFRKGNLAGGAPAAHGEAVKKGVLEYVDQITALIKDANK